MPITLLKTLFTLSCCRQSPLPSLDKALTTEKPNIPPPSLKDADDDGFFFFFSSSSSADVESQRSPSSPPSPKNRLISPRIISDATIGLSDGLTVPFALTAGLSALGDTRTVIFGGLAELIAGAISMGLGGYLGAKSEADSHKTHHAQLSTHLLSQPPPPAGCLPLMLASRLTPLNLPQPTLDLVLSHASASISPELVDFLLTPPGPSNSRRPIISAVTISLGYFLGGLIPLIPYFCVKELMRALYTSVGVMAVALFVFGYVKTGLVVGNWNKRKCVWGGVQMILVGGMAAGAAMGLVKGLSGAGVGGSG
ncbi:vacuolar iron transporter Ccc1 [Cladorrhinum sp. PSN332]|nr:vacuolar iron transporter Ccc1 [Cladorrhinum sp. PSN332]